ncbi:MAG: GspH/FimT family pseudopilin [Mariprofundales bacterium]
MDSSHFIVPTLRRATKAWQAQAGFTLIEMMVVVAIVGVIAGIAVPGYQSMQAKMNVSGATGTLLGHLKQARHLAISEGRSVNIDFTASSYVFDSGSTKSRTVKMLSYGNVQLSNNASDQLTFSSRGTSSSKHVIVSTGTLCKQININIIGRAFMVTDPTPCP